MAIPPPFNPSQQQWGLYPVASKQTIWQGNAPDNGLNGYLRGVLRFKTGHWGVACASNYGPWTFNATVGAAVYDLRYWVRLNADPNFPLNQVVDGPLWAWLDLLAGL